ncbi:MAG: hypothetical protein KDC95_06015 [Planctomycetes bacterium]|nr:hypothetical protein [Planctomycetota bacterium]
MRSFSERSIYGLCLVVSLAGAWSAPEIQGKRFALAATRQQQKPEDALETPDIADLEFDAWAAEIFDCDFRAARLEAAEIATKEGIAQWTRARAYNDLVRLSRLSGDYSELERVTKALTGQPDLTTGQRIALTGFLRAFERGKVEAFQSFERAKRAYERAIENATNAEERARARASFFTDVRQATRTLRRPSATLLPDVARNGPRPMFLASNRPFEPSRELVVQSRMLISMQKNIDDLVAKSADRDTIDGAVAEREDLRARLLPRAQRTIRAFRLEIESFEREGNTRATESLVDAVTELEKAIAETRDGDDRALPETAPVDAESLRRRLEDAVNRRRALQALLDSADTKIRTLQASGDARARSLEAWKNEAATLVRDGRWFDAAQRTLELSTEELAALL